jgi:hypothetical protein
MEKYVARLLHSIMLTRVLTGPSGLMEKDEWRNLGLANLPGDAPPKDNPHDKGPEEGRQEKPKS